MSERRAEEQTGGAGHEATGRTGATEPTEVTEPPSGLEQHQVWLYLGAAVLGAALGLLVPGAGAVTGVLLWPLLAALLFATFVQTPLQRVREAGRDRRWLGTVLVANGLVMPVFALCLVAGVEVFGRVLVGSEAQVTALALGLLLVLAVPCTDWFLTFSYLSWGDRAAAVVITPVNLVLQLVSLPVWVWLFTVLWGRGGLGTGGGAGGATGAGPGTADAAGGLPGVGAALLSPGVIAGAVLVVLVPLAAATLFERVLRRSPQGELRRQRLANWPIPLLTAVVFLVAAGNAPAVAEASGVLWVGVLVCVVYLGGAVLAGTVAGDIAGLPRPQRRTLVCTLGTRNSFVVLPIALALPTGWELAAAVVVAQSIVELLGMGVVSRWLAARAVRGEGGRVESVGT